MPGLPFSNYRALDVALISEDQYLEMLNNYVSINDWKGGSVMKAWIALNETYQWTNGIPKSSVMVKLVDGISSDDRNYIANGMRSRLDDPFT